MRNFKMTLNEALHIQKEQVRFYGEYVPGGEDALRARVAELNADLSEYDLDAPMSIGDMYHLVPRGAAIEEIVYDMTGGRVQFGGD